MRNRLLFLILFLIFRFILGWTEVSLYKQNSLIKVTGNIDKIYHNDTNCIIKVGRFFIDYRNECSFSRLTKIEAIGRVRRGLIDSFLGRLWLVSDELSVLKGQAETTAKGTYFLTIINDFRENMVDVYRSFLPVPESGLVAGIILGYKKDIGQEFYEQMVKSGSIHIAVASGYNIMLVGGVVLSLSFWLVKRKWATVIAIIAMIFYAVEAGGEPPVLRAVVMAGLIFWATAIGRRSISWWILLVTGWLMVLIDPLYLLDVSFQLSMAASVGLIVVEPWVRKIIETKGEGIAVALGGSGFLTSLSTMLMTIPIIWWHFGRMSWIGILSNLLILPLVPVLMILGAGMQVIPGLFFWPTYVITHWMVEVIRFFGS